MIQNRVKIILGILGLILLFLAALYTYQYFTYEERALDKYHVLDDGLPHNYYLLPDENIAELADETTDPTDRATHLLRAVELIKKADPYNLDTIIAGYADIYRDTTLPDRERALALFKISQQANGYNRFDLMDDFLPAEAHKLPAGEKNYELNKVIYELYPFGIVYTDLRVHEILKGEEYNIHEVYYHTTENLKKEVADFAEVPHLADMIPDIYMHAGTLLSLIDSVSVPDSLVSPDEVLWAFESGEHACGSSRHISPRCTTADFIKIARIDYLLKLGRATEAENEIKAFLASDVRPMMRLYITEYNGLELGRYKYLEARQDLVYRIKNAIPDLPDPS